MATTKTAKTATPSEREPEYTVRLTPKGEQYVAEQAQLERTAAKLAVAAAKMEQAERLAGDWRSEWRSWLQRERGMCSEADCDAPIAGWCATCDAGGPFKAPKWCEAHLRAHLAREHHVAYWLYHGPATPGGAA
jgi:hypothetical protein